MAETDLYKTMINNPQLPQNPNKFYTHFFYKAVFVSIFLLLLPLFPSEAPDFINHTINTRSWELLQLLFVGIAVSYGLFSKRNDEQQQQQQQQQPNKSDNAQSYVARLLQVSSVFDDDSETPSEPNHSNNNKVQTWNSQYYRGEPIVVVAKETSQQAADSSATVEKPLLLPVRSLKNGVSESSSMIDFKVGRSNSRRFNRNLSKLSGVSPESEEENIVLQSPIPWRSRSGRMEIKEEFTQTPEIINHSSDPPSLSLSSEIQSKSLQDVGRKKIPTTKSSSFSPIPPPPPPPPPPPYHRRMNLTNTQNRTDTYSRKEFRRNARSFPNKFSEDIPMAAKSNSFRTPRQQTEFDEYLLHDSEIERFLERRGSQKKKFMADDEEKKEFMEAEKDVEEEESDEDELQELASKNGEIVGNDHDHHDHDHDHGPDVDKKADEFIAKFREQIRLQRIASIRRSTTQTTPKIGGR
ncbi:uncharacterized protein LOC111908933 [Lactuca sativa]|uniref:DUF4408 domain-containing protein n=1 Tax=Lactuca sativa TaxID=4236 RepID=A0A9R1V640_LACSA|nr:uncharacterized protein LOC111908933 [Lactuca sativa]KAJ0198953.1 hypothetical protein LSAT_V11C600337660 [Lactuca sativa]